MTNTQRRDYKMPTGGIDDLVRDYAYMCDDNTADDELRNAASIAATKYHAAVKLAADARHDHITIAGELHRIERTANDDMWQMFAAGKRPSIDATITRIDKMTDDVHQARKRYKYCDDICSRASGQLGQVIRDRPRAVIAWVAAHRARTDDLAAKTDDALPIPVLRIYHRLGVLGNQPSPYGLDLAHFENNGQLTRVPIEWPGTWPDTVRASLAWWWRQIADDRYVLDERGRLIITAAPYGDLPQVPPQRR